MIFFAAAWADEPAVDDDDAIIVTAEKPTKSGTDRTLNRTEIQAFPARSADEMLRAMPGMHLSAHGGRGKAFQFLVRGFDAEHGADFAAFLEGVPLNEPSNVHGQGYLDLHFLPKALIASLDLTKGSYAAEYGDFAITGSADYHVGLDASQVSVTGGTDRGAGATVAFRPKDRGEGSFAVAEVAGALGVGDGRDYLQGRLASGIDGTIGATTLRAMAFGYQGRFDSPGVLRQDDLDRGDLGFYEAYPVVRGGLSRRVLALADARVVGRASSARAMIYGGVRQLRLDQNFTGYLGDPVHGDGSRQAELAWDGGFRADVQRSVPVWGRSWGLRGGVEGRIAVVDMTEHDIDQDGVPFREVIDADARHVDAAIWTEGRLQLLDGLDLTPGVRADWIQLAVRDRLQGSPEAHSGAPVLSPRLSTSWRPVSPLTLLAAYGRGFRSPDARGIGDGDLAPVTQSDSAEAGARLSPCSICTVGASAFVILVSDELIFDNVAARFLSAGRTRRAGIEATTAIRPAPWLRVELDVTYTDGRFTATEAPIPYAPRWFGAVGIYTENAPLAGGQLVAGLRTWYLGTRPLPAGFASRPSVAGSLTADWRRKHLELGLQIDNPWLTRWRDGEFVFPSWFDQEKGRSELKTLHVTPGDPFAVRVSVGWHG